MKILRIILSLGVVLIFGYSSAVSIEDRMERLSSSIPYVATHEDIVRDMLSMANVGEDDVVYDLGSGDGRIVIAAVRDFGARKAVGIEIKPELIKKSRENAKKAGVADKVKFIEGDLFEQDFREASVVTLFLGHNPNIKLRPRIFKALKPGTRIVSHQFGMGEWKPDKILTIREALPGMYGEMFNPFKENPHVPDYDVHEVHFGTGDKVIMWVVPASVAGVWRGDIKKEEDPKDFELVLHQRLSQGSGRFRISGENNQDGGVSFDICGDRVKYECVPDNMNRYRGGMRFDGHIRGDTMEGTLSYFDEEEKKRKEGTWKVKREPVDYTGTWEWPFASGGRSVRLRIEKHDGDLKATYLDGDKEIPVTDFYDFGGGFYFTLRLNMPWEGGFAPNYDSGWLVGEAILKPGVVSPLKGRSNFYPYRDFSPPERWSPRLIKP